MLFFTELRAFVYSSCEGVSLQWTSFIGHKLAIVRNKELKLEKKHSLKMPIYCFQIVFYVLH